MNGLIGGQQAKNWEPGKNGVADEQPSTAATPAPYQQQQQQQQQQVMPSSELVAHYDRLPPSMFDAILDQRLGPMNWPPASLRCQHGRRQLHACTGDAVMMDADAESYLHTLPGSVT